MGEIDLSALLGGLLAITWQQGIMVVVGGTLMFLAIAKKYEPTLLLPRPTQGLPRSAVLSSRSIPSSGRPRFYGDRVS